MIAPNIYDYSNQIYYTVPSTEILINPNCK
jgi:hypothetical protein